MTTIRHSDLLRVRVTNVIDGDSLDVVILGKPDVHRVRLFAIDAPDQGQRFHRESSHYLAAHALNRDFIMEVVTPRDNYGRIVAVLYDEHRGRSRSLNRRMVLSGWAYHWNYFGSLPELPRDEHNARTNSRGMWASARMPAKPWIFRRVRRQTAWRWDDRMPDAPEWSGRGCLSVVAIPVIFSLVVGFAVVVWQIASAIA